LTFEGEIDLSIASGSWTRYGRLNYTLIEQLFSNDPENQYHSPRYRIPGVIVFNKKYCGNENLDPNGCKS
jgi:hypothetical protein